MNRRCAGISPPVAVSRLRTHRVCKWAKRGGAGPARKAGFDSLRRHDAGIGRPRRVASATTGSAPGVHPIHLPQRQRRKGRSAAAWVAHDLPVVRGCAAMRPYQSEMTFGKLYSHVEWGNLVERPLAYDDLEELARRGQIYWLDPDGTKHTIPVRREA